MSAPAASSGSCSSTETVRLADRAQTRLDVVIVAYGGRELLRRCLRSLREHPAGAGMTVTVVDNAGGDGVPEMVRAEFPEFRLLEMGWNAGFARGSNAGIRAGSARYALALNPDAAVAAGCLDLLVELLDADPRIGCAGAALYQEDGSFDHAARRGFPTPLSALGHFSGIGRRLSSGRLAAYRAPEIERGPVEAVNGAFMMLRREALEQVGLFDEGYWMYMEDLDLCRRLADAGWTTWFEPAAVAVHSKGGTTEGVRSPRLEIAFHRGMGRYYRRHLAPAGNGLLNLAVYAGIGLKLALALLRTGARRARSG
jgi:N-acetylglucosaminyl-diphospho-decaprenol L-rhamnosyltransferase